MKNQYLIYIVFIFLINQNILAQLETKTWLITPLLLEIYQDSLSIKNSGIFSITASNGGVVSLSDENGNYLMSSCGQEVFNSSGQMMANGHTLIGGWVSTQHIFIPKPGYSERYYVVVTPYGGPLLTNNASYSEIDISLNGGLGDVISTNKNIILGPASIYSTGKVTACYHENGKDIWLLIHQQETNNFFSYLVTENGIPSSPTSMISIGLNHQSSGAWQAGKGEMKFSPDGSKLAVAVKGMDAVELFDFNSKTGEISNPITFTGVSRPHSVEFSLDGTVLYYSNDNIYDPWPGTCSCNADTVFIMQVDLLAGDSLDIVSSASPIFSNLDTSSNKRSIAIQLAYNGKIIVSFCGLDSIYSINHPEVLGDSCDFDFAISLSSGFGVHEFLPNFFRSYLDRNILVQDTCFGLNTFIYTETNLNFDSIRWEFTDSASMQFVTVANQDSVFHTFSEPGDYEIQLYRYRNGNEDMIKKCIYILPNVNFALQDTTLCPDETLAINCTSAYANIAWVKDSIADTTYTNNFIISQNGTFWPFVTNFEEICGSLDTITVDYIEVGTQLPADTSGLCITNPIELNLTYQFSDSLLWSTGEITDTILALQSGQYIATVFYDGCPDADTVLVEYDIPLTPDLGNDVYICPDDTISLFGGDFNASYFWDPTGDTVEMINTILPGLYILTLSNSCGDFTDSILITELFPPVVNLGNDTAICTGDSLTLSSQLPALCQFLWSTGDTVPAISIQDSGMYWLEATNICGSDIDYKNVSVDYPLEINLGNDTTICIGDTVQLTINHSPFTIIEWSTGETTPEILILDSGIYWLQVQNACGIFSDTFQLFVNDPELNFGNDTIPTPSQAVQLDAGEIWESYLWSTGETNQSIMAADSGWFSVIVSDDLGCLTSDSVYIMDISAIFENEHSKIKIYPNPAKEELIISNIPENSEVLIYTLQGQRVSVTPTLSKFTLDISNLESGAYFLEIRIDNVSIGRKLFVKE